MAATIAVGSYFSTAATPQLSSKLSSSDAVLRLTCSRPLRMPTITNLAEHLSTPVASHKWRLLRITAVVVQEEATATVQEEEEEEEEKETMEEGGKEEEVVVATPASQNTKLYFGNLPYNCDSAQLAGIVRPGPVRLTDPANCGPKQKRKEKKKKKRIKTPEPPDSVGRSPTRGRHPAAPQPYKEPRDLPFSLNRRAIDASLPFSSSFSLDLPVAVFVLAGNPRCRSPSKPR